MSDIKAYTTQIDTDPVTGEEHTVYVSNMGTPEGKGIAHFCCDCMLPFREKDLVKFRGRWYGIPCGDFQHARDILLKEKQRSWRPKTVKEPGSVPFVVR